MNKHLSSASLKSLAKGQLLGKYSTLVAAYAIHLCCIAFTTFSTALLVDTSTVIGTVIFYAISVLLNLLGGLFLYGEAYIYLKIACNRPVTVNDLFHGFQTVPDKILKVQFVFAMVSLVCSLPELLSPSLMQNPENPYLILIYISLTIIATVVNVIFSLTYSQCYYLMLDFPDHTHKEVFAQSKRIMKGNRGRLFYIELSFLPLLCLGLCSCCITYLWLFPYIQAVQANFYLDLMKKKD